MRRPLWLFAGINKLQAARIIDLSQEGCRVRSKERLAVRSGWPVEVSFKVSGVVFGSAACCSGPTVEACWASTL